MAALTPDETILAREQIAFIDHIRETYFARIEKLNGRNTVEARDHRTDTGIYAVKVARGAVIEKAGFFTSIVTAPMPPFLGDAKWNRYMEIDVHAKSPLTPFLHLTMTFQFMKDGSSGVGGWMDVLEGPQAPKDIAYIQTRMDAAFARHNVDIKPFRERLLRKREDNPYRRHPAGSGATLLPPPERPITTESAAFVRDAFETMLSAYLDVAEKHRSDRGTADDLKGQAAMRKNWLEDQLFSDPFSGKLVPYAVWGLSNAPPAVAF